MKTFTHWKPLDLSGATLSSSRAEEFAGSEPFPQFREVGHGSPATSDSQSSGCRVFCLAGAQALSSGVWEQGRRQAKKHSRGGLLTAGTLLFTCAWAVIHISEATQAREVPFVEVCNKDKYRIHLFLEVLICGMILSLLEVINLLCHTLYNFWRKTSSVVVEVVCAEQGKGSLQN